MDTEDAPSEPIIILDVDMDTSVIHGSYWTFLDMDAAAPSASNHGHQSYPQQRKAGSV